MPPAKAPPEPTEPGSPETREDVGPGLYGVIDVLRADRVAGWVVDRRDSQAVVEVDIRREGRLIATVNADRSRRDLVQTGVGTGRYGFACDLEPSLEHGFEFTVTATARASDGVSTELKRPGSKMPANPDRRLAERVFEEVMRLGQRSGEPESQSRTTPDELREVVQNIEIAQARIEATLAAIEPMASPSQLGLKLILGVSLAVAVISLALGIYSMWLQ